MKLKDINKPHLITVGGEVREIKPKNGSDFQLDELKEYIGGGWIQIVPLSDDRLIMVMDEEGKLKNMPMNSVATDLFHEWGIIDDVIVGDVVVCHKDQVL